MENFTCPIHGECWSTMISPQLLKSLEDEKKKISKAQLVFISAYIAHDIWLPGFWAYTWEEAEIGLIYSPTASEENLEQNLEIIAKGIPYCSICFESVTVDL